MGQWHSLPAGGGSGRDDGTHPPHTKARGLFSLQFNLLWRRSIPGNRSILPRQVHEALRILRRQNIQREKGGPRSEAAKYHSADHYRKATEQAGFKVVDVYEEVVSSSYEFWDALCGDHQYAAGALPGYPVAEAAKALQEGVVVAFTEHGLTRPDGRKHIPRPWLMVAAQA